MSFNGVSVNKTIPTFLGLALKERRHALDLSQEELAWRAGLNRTCVTDVERGSRNLSLATLEKLATALETPPFVSLRDMDQGGDSNALDALRNFSRTR